MLDAATCDWTTGQDGIAPLQRNRFTALAGTEECATSGTLGIRIATPRDRRCDRFGKG